MNEWIDEQPTNQPTKWPKEGSCLRTASCTPESEEVERAGVSPHALLERDEADVFHTRFEAVKVVDGYQISG